MSISRNLLCFIGVVLGLLIGSAISAKGDYSMVRCASTFPGADAGAKINAAIANLPRTGGTIVADFEGAQNATATITIPANVWLQLGAMTLSGSANPLIKVTGSGGQRLSGALAAANAQTTATTVKNTGRGITLSLDNGGANLRGFRLENLNLDGSNMASTALSMNNAGNGVVDKVEIFGHLSDGIKINGAIDLTLRDFRVSAGTGVLSGAFGVNIDGALTSTTITMERIYISGYTTGLRNANGVNVLTVGNIYESVKNGVWNSQNGFAAINDYFEGDRPFSKSYILDSGGTATIVAPHGAALASIDHSRVVDKSRLNFILPLDGTTVGKLSVLSGVTNKGGGFKHIRAPIGSIAANATVGLTVVWVPAFADANYTIVGCSVEDSSGFLQTYQTITAKGAQSFTINVKNTDGGTSHMGMIDCLAVHD